MFEFAEGQKLMQIVGEVDLRPCTFSARSDDLAGAVGGVAWGTAVRLEEEGGQTSNSTSRIIIR
eukprot:3303893-Rhodomonas_salina.2